MGPRMRTNPSSLTGMDPDPPGGMSHVCKSGTTNGRPLLPIGRSRTPGASARRRRLRPPRRKRPLARSRRSGPCRIKKSAPRTREEEAAKQAKKEAKRAKEAARDGPQKAAGTKSLDEWQSSLPAALKELYASQDLDEAVERLEGLAQAH